jgi:hypothetical protein
MHLEGKTFFKKVQKNARSPCKERAFPTTRSNPSESGVDCVAWEGSNANVGFKLSNEPAGEKRADDALLADCVVGDGFLKDLVTSWGWIVDRSVVPKVHQVVEFFELHEEVVDFGFAGGLIDLLVCHG